MITIRERRMVVMKEIEILKELIIMVKKKNYRCAWCLGLRTDTSEDKRQRSKDIRAFIVDLFGDEDEDIKELLDILEDEINKNVYGNMELECRPFFGITDTPHD